MAVETPRRRRVRVGARQREEPRTHSFTGSPTLRTVLLAYARGSTTKDSLCPNRPPPVGHAAFLIDTADWQRIYSPSCMETRHPGK